MGRYCHNCFISVPMLTNHVKSLAEYRVFVRHMGRGGGPPPSPGARSCWGCVGGAKQQYWPIGGGHASPCPPTGRSPPCSPRFPLLSRACFRPWPPSLCGPNWGLAEVGSSEESFHPAESHWTEPGSIREEGCGRETWVQAHTPETWDRLESLAQDLQHGRVKERSHGETQAHPSSANLFHQVNSNALWSNVDLKNGRPRAVDTLRLCVFSRVMMMKGQTLRINGNVPMSL